MAAASCHSYSARNNHESIVTRTGTSVEQRGHITSQHEVSSEQNLEQPVQLKNLQADESSSATAKVINTPDLLESILSNLTIFKLVSARRVSKAFQQLIDTSPTLQKSPFLRPVDECAYRIAAKPYLVIGPNNDASGAANSPISDSRTGMLDGGKCKVVTAPPHVLGPEPVTNLCRRWNIRVLRRRWIQDVLEQR